MKREDLDQSIPSDEEPVMAFSTDAFAYHKLGVGLIGAGSADDHGASAHEKQREPDGNRTDAASHSSLTGLVEAFLLNRRVGNCSGRTLEVYECNLRHFAQAVSGELSACVRPRIQIYLAALADRMKPISVHQHFRTLRTFTSATRQTCT